MLALRSVSICSHFFLFVAKAFWLAVDTLLVSGETSVDATASIYRRWCDVKSPNFVKSLSFDVVNELRQRYESRQLTAESFVVAQQQAFLWIEKQVLKRFASFIVCAVVAPLPVVGKDFFLNIMAIAMTLRQLFPRLLQSSEFVKLKQSIDDATTHKVCLSLRFVLKT